MALKASPRQHLLRPLQLQLLNVVDPSRITAIVGPIFFYESTCSSFVFFRRIPCLVLHTSRFQCWIPSLDLRPFQAANQSKSLDGPRLAHLYTELTMARTEAASIKAEKEQLEAVTQADPTGLKSINQQLCKGWSWWWRQCHTAMSWWERRSMLIVDWSIHAQRGFRN